MLRMSYEIGLRCWSAYFAWRKLPAAAGQLGLEAEICKVSRWSKIANTATGIVISSANQLAMNGKRLQIQLPECFQRGVIIGGGTEICGRLLNNFFRSVVQFSEKLREALYVG